MSNPSLNYHLSGYLAGIMNFVVPFIVIPIVSYKIHNWWLLIGIIPVFIGETISASPKIRWGAVSGVILFLVSECIINGFHLQNLMTFYSVCFLFGFFCHRLQTPYSAPTMSPPKPAVPAAKPTGITAFIIMRSTTGAIRSAPQ